MNRTELIAEVAERSGLTKKDAEKAVVALFDAVVEEVAAGNKVQIVGFGTFEQRIRKEREGVSPRTKEKMVIPEAKVPAFKPGRSFKETVNK
ncbi:MAG: HU family DNA-binding protein [Clostridia bacterium]|jgi:DNA-binding protein HU-beta|nr:HU family DNA-binding protein [Clostridia bacterium]